MGSIQKKIKKNFSKLPFTIQEYFIKTLSIKDFLINKKMIDKSVFEFYFSIYNQNAFVIQKFLRNRITFEYGRWWRFISWDYLRNNPNKFYNIFCSASGKQWRSVDFLTSYNFCFMKSGGSSLYPRICFFCSCTNGDCLDHLKPFIFLKSVKILI